MIKLLQNILKSELFLHGVGCGPSASTTGGSAGSWQKRQYFNAASSMSFSKYALDVPKLIPDVCYHPEFYVCIDFSHQFVMNANIKGKQQGERLISKELLKNIVEKLGKFIYYYFDYVITYGKNSKININSFLETMTLTEEHSVAFLNTVLNYFITDVTITRSLTDIGACSITLRDSLFYSSSEGEKTRLFHDVTLDILNQLLAPMLPVMVWAKGRLYKDWFFPIFDGYVIAPTMGDQQGFKTVDIACKDTLELARITSEMVNTSILQIGQFKTQNAINIFTKPFYNRDHMEIFKFMVHGGNMVLDLEGNQTRIDVDTKPETGPNNKLNFDALGDFDKCIEPDSFTNGVRPALAEEEKVIHKDSLSMLRLLSKTKHSRKRRSIAWGESITPYRLFQNKAPETYTSEFASRLDILRDVASMVYYDLYVDGYGNIQYHPMRMANNYLKLDMYYLGKNDTVEHSQMFPGAQVLTPEEITNISSLLNLDELTTFLRLVGTDPLLTAAPADYLGNIGTATNEIYMNKYGYRRKEVNNPLFNYNVDIYLNGNTMKFLDAAADSLLKFMNAELYTRTATIIFRPELEIGLPVFFTEDNNVFYVQSITHTITVGGDATTTINANYGRMDKQSAPELFNFLSISEKLYKNSGTILPGVLGQLEQIVMKIPSFKLGDNITKLNNLLIKEQKGLDAISQNKKGVKKTTPKNKTGTTSNSKKENAQNQKQKTNLEFGFGLIKI